MPIASCKDMNTTDSIEKQSTPLTTTTVNSSTTKNIKILSQVQTVKHANGEWGMWNDWKFCEVNCVREDTTEGIQRRWRTCNSSICSGNDMEEKSAQNREYAKHSVLNSCIHFWTRDGVRLQNRIRPVPNIKDKKVISKPMQEMTISPKVITPADVAIIFILTKWNVKLISEDGMIAMSTAEMNRCSTFNTV
ncbi:unnamed protein product [Mytilus edulis]|uniref:Uncharacterized protein n=1 Tax=Mytilus edulis TaxID=6550 RepID=A0A8S3V3Q6_MYTED|nr:unnamed protein product [Mytilus edulis]